MRDTFLYTAIPWGFVKSAWLWVASEPGSQCEQHSKHSSVVFNQLCQLIPAGMVRHLAAEYGVDQQVAYVHSAANRRSAVVCSLKL